MKIAHFYLYLLLEIFMWAALLSMFAPRTALAAIAGGGVGVVSPGMTHLPGPAAN